MKVKTSSLAGAALDWAVAQCEGISVHVSRGGWIVFDADAWPQFRNDYNDYKLQSFAPSTNWALGGPITEREGIEIRKGNDLYFPQGNENGDYYEPLWLAGKQHGPTPLIAAMRCYVTAKLGNEVEVPEELLD